MEGSPFPELDRYKRLTEDLVDQLPLQQTSAWSFVSYVLLWVSSPGMLQRAHRAPHHHLLLGCTLSVWSLPAPAPAHTRSGSFSPPAVIPATHPAVCLTPACPTPYVPTCWLLLSCLPLLQTWAESLSQLRPACEGEAESTSRTESQWNCPRCPKGLQLSSEAYQLCRSVLRFEQWFQIRSGKNAIMGLLNLNKHHSFPNHGLSQCLMP